MNYNLTLKSDDPCPIIVPMTGVVESIQICRDSASCEAKYKLFRNDQLLRVDTLDEGMYNFTKEFSSTLYANDKLRVAGCLKQYSYHLTIRIIEDSVHKILSILDAGQLAVLLTSEDQKVRQLAEMEARKRTYKGGEK